MFDYRMVPICCLEFFARIPRSEAIISLVLNPLHERLSRSEGGNTWVSLGYTPKWQVNREYNRRKFRSETSDNMDRWKSRAAKSQRRESQKKEDPGARKGRKVAIHCVFPMICGSGGSKSRLAKEMKRCTPLVREAHFQVKMYKTHQVRSTFRSSDVEKVHAVVARSTFRSQNC